jgi:hypothetical protein
MHTLGAMAVNRSRKARAARRRKRRMERVEHELSDDQWTALKAAWGCCAYCGATDKPLLAEAAPPLPLCFAFRDVGVHPACPGSYGGLWSQGRCAVSVC